MSDRRRVIMGQKKSRLPSEYQEVEWIAGDDTGGPMLQIGTLSSVNVDIKFTAQFKRINNGSGYPAPVSWLPAFNDTQVLINQHQGVEVDGVLYVTFGNTVDKYLSNIGVSAISDFYDYHLNKDVFSIGQNGTELFTTSIGASTFNTGTLCILGKASDNCPSDAKFKSLIITNTTNNTVIYNFIPCYRKSDNVIGMYDIVNAVFITNSRRGNLTKGLDVIKEEIPEEYQELLYIQGTGTQYIDTGFTPNSNTKIDLDLTIINTPYSRLYGSYEGSGWTNNNFGAYFNSSGATFYVNYNNDTLLNNNPPVNNRFIFTQDKNLVCINNLLVQTLTSSSFNCVSSLFLFKLNRSGEYNTSGGKFKLYKCRIYDNGNLFRNFIPCYRISDNASGLYDTITDQFYVNQAQGNDFIKGNNV